MLSLGVAIGAAIGPAPSASLAGQRIPGLLGTVVGLTAGSQAATQAPTTTTSLPPGADVADRTRAASPAAAPTSPAAAPGAAAPAPGDSEQAEGSARTEGHAAPGSRRSKTRPTGVSPTSRHDAARAPAPIASGEGSQPAPLPPVTSVWLITLAGGSFAQARAQPASAPYIDGQLIKTGALLSDWSALAGEAFAGEAGLLGGVPPQNLDAIVQPPCPEGAAGASCQPETAGALAAADAFLRATLPTIIASTAYRAHGLIVITFATVANATAASLPPGASTATLGSEPPTGVLLLSPFVRAGAQPHDAFDPASPRQSVSALLR